MGTDRWRGHLCNRFKREPIYTHSIGDSTDNVTHWPSQKPVISSEQMFGYWQPCSRDR